MVKESAEEFVSVKKLPDFCMHFVPPKTKTRCKGLLADAKQSQEKSFKLEDSKLYQFMNDAASNIKSADIENPRELVLEHIRYINAIAHPILKSWTDPSSGAIKQPSAAELDSIEKNEGHATRIAALKHLFMICGELDRHARTGRSPELDKFLLKCGRGYDEDDGRGRVSVRNKLHHEFLQENEADTVSLRDVIMLCRQASYIGKKNRQNLSLAGAPLFKVPAVVGETKESGKLSAQSGKNFTV